VPLEHQARIFEPYFTTKPLGAGSGLGLATAYGLVKQSGGFLLLDRSARRGACFTIYLPEAAEPDRADPSARPGEAPARLLLVEDEQVLRAAMARALERAGLAVTAVPDARAALERLAEGFEPGLLVTDIRMPGMDGVALSVEARRLRPGLPILMVSGYADASERDRLGALDVGFLPKPFSLAELCGRAREMLAG
jgi:two-component system cell cycle sensor histidine kinase/response regulator CckA